MSTTKNIKYVKKPVDFSTLVGTYRWVWDGQDGMYPCHEIGPGISGKQDEGFITLSLKGASDDLANVCGSFKYGSFKGSFEGITPFIHKSTGKVFPGVWNIKRVKWVDAGNMPKDKQELWVTKQKDDQGHPFVGMYLTTGFIGWAGTRAWDVVGKKQKDGYSYGIGIWEGLSAEEMERLGLREEDDSEDYDSEDYSGEDDDEEGEVSEEDSEDDEGEGDDPEDAASSISGDKSESEDTGAATTDDVVSKVTPSRKRKASSSVSEASEPVKVTRQRID